MRKIKCIITDDEPLARKGLREYVNQVGFLTLVGECEDAIQLNNLLKEQDADLLLLDIEMPYLSGIEFLNGITNPPQVIFTTAYERYALKGYELNVTDYLLKPITFERFLQAVNKVYYNIEKEQRIAADDHIFVRTDGLLKRIGLSDILFVEGMENYVIIHTANSKEVVRNTLKKIAELLPAGVFLQVHRSYIININKIDSIEGNMINIDNTRIPISKNYRDTVFAALLDKDKG